MKRTAFINGKVLTRGQFRTGLTVIINGGRIESVKPGKAKVDGATESVDLDGGYLAPGFIDTQVNGGGGVLFNDEPTVEGIRSIAAAHRRFGTTGLLPTLISDELDILAKALSAAKDAIRDGVPGVLGIHIEGPFLNPERKGIHDARKLQSLTGEIAAELEPLPNGPTLLTLAPEIVDARTIQALADKGFIVSCGHSNATQAQVKQALEHGVSGFTHLFNAMSPLTAREPGVVGQALADTKSWCGIIADGHHVAPTSLEVAFRCKGPDRLMLVTDAMPPVGSSQKTFRLMGQQISVNDGVCQDSAGTLAGAALDMATAVRNMPRFTGCSLAEACTMASATPAAFLGIDGERGSVMEGQHADLVVLDDHARVMATFIAGREAGRSVQPVGQ